MLITCAQLYPVALPMTKPIKMAGETVTHAHTLLLRLVDEEGREGWGEASSAPLMTGETLGSVAASTEYLVSKLVGVQIDRPDYIAPLQERVLYGNAAAKSCHETALMDLFAQRAAIPLYQMLAGTNNSATPARLEMLHMLASGELESELEEARSLRTDGYRQWKIKVGSGDTEKDIRRIRTLCAELKGDIVSADANQCLSLAAAENIAAAGAAAGLSFLEQPYRTDMMDEMVALHRSSGLNLCADESIQDVADMRAHALSHAAQGVSLKLNKQGGTQLLVDAGRLCLSHGLRINLACKVAETTISAAATAHAGLAIGDIAWGFSMSNRYLNEDICSQPLQPEHGAVSTAQFTGRTGLGYAPDADRLREFASSTVASREFRA